MHHRFDVDALKRDHPIEDVVAGYGVELRRSGRALVGRCPFHHDQGRPNLHVYPENGGWFCYRCSIGGDVLSFVMRHEGLRFAAACARLSGAPVAARGRRRPPPSRRAVPRPRASEPAERACLAAAAELYQNRLQVEPTALRYLEARGVDPTTIDRCRIGFAAGGELSPFLRWRGLPARAAVRVGLLTRDGRETMAGRVVVPEIRDGQVVWLIGRALGAEQPGPKYLGLPGAKPLLGWENACRSRTAFAVEGVFGYLALRRWGYPALCLLGTHVRPEVVAALERFERLYLVLDDDEAGRAAADALLRALAPRAVPVVVPGVVDVDELAPRADGRLRFARALEPVSLPAAA